MYKIKHYKKQKYCKNKFFCHTIIYKKQKLYFLIHNDIN